MNDVSSTKPRLAWFSPLNTEQVTTSVAAYFSDQLLPLLTKRFEIDLYHDRFEPKAGFETYHYLSAWARHHRQPYDAFIYNVEDCASADFVRTYLGVTPGIAIFHDLLFERKIPLNVAISPWDETIDNFNRRTYNWPERREDEPDGGANTKKADAKFSAREKLRLAGPIGFREAGLCAVPVFTSPWTNLEFRRNVARTLKATTGEKQQYYLPYPIMTAPVPAASMSSEPIICFCGSAKIEHRSHKLLQALSQIRAPYKFIWLIKPSEQSTAEALLKEFGVGNAEIVLGRSPAKWAEVVKGARVAVHTLFSVFGQCNPWLALSLAAGVPSLVTAFQASDYLSDEVVFKIEPGEHEATQIQGVVESLLTGRADVNPASLIKYAQENHSAALIADEFASIIEQSELELAGITSRWSVLERQATLEVMRRAHSMRLSRFEGFEDIGSQWNELIQRNFEELSWK